VEPACIKNNGRRAGRLTFELLIQAVFNRLQLLSSIYGGAPFCIDRNTLMELSAAVKVVSDDLRLDSYSIFSRSSSSKRELTGLVGDVVFEGDLTVFLPYINIGSVLHVGGNTVLGMGQYLWAIEA